MASYLLAIDQGTTSSRAILFDREGRSVATAQREFPQHYPHDGWIEHDPEDIWETVLATCREVIASRGIELAEIAGVGITNQRETTLLWDRETGEALHPAIVWQDRRTDEACRR
ncbi:MAG: FGGY family carbohydrate kinase, partial [Halomonas sp.]|nr:FGGY family carbohydrate kinase [Halomonas sp.]